MCELYYCQIYLYLNAINSFNEKEKKTVEANDCVQYLNMTVFYERNIPIHWKKCDSFPFIYNTKECSPYHSFIKPSDTQLNEDNKLKQTTPAHVIYSTLKGVVDCTKFKPLRFALQAEFNKIKLCLNI